VIARILKENMKNTNRNRYKRIRTRFAAGTRFEIGSLAPVPERGTAEQELEGLKTRLLGAMLPPELEPDLSTALQRAANDAASAAWFTPFPLLVFPTLLEEKAAAARLQHERQREIRERTQGLLEQAISE